MTESAFSCRYIATVMCSLQGVNIQIYSNCFVKPAGRGSISNIEVFKNQDVQISSRPVCEETHHHGAYDEKAAHQNPKYEEGGAGRVLNHLEIESSN